MYICILVVSAPIYCVLLCMIVVVLYICNGKWERESFLVMVIVIHIPVYIHISKCLVECIQLILTHTVHIYIHIYTSIYI